MFLPVPDLDPESTGICGSGYRKAKITHRKEKKVHSVKSWMFYLKRWCCPYINLYIENFCYLNTNQMIRM
jgi:hypothetical protein